MSRNALIAFGFATIAIAAPAPVSAAVLIFSTNLAGSNEIPPVTTQGSGTGVVTIDTTANTLRVALNFANLTGNTTASHLHCCGPANVNSPVATTTPTFPGFPLGVTSGAYDQTFDLTLASSFNAAFLNNLVNGGNITTARNTLFNGIIAGQSYLNIHTNFALGGEIRGQLTAVPEVSTWAMMLVGFAGVGAAMRRRRSGMLTSRA